MVKINQPFSIGDILFLEPLYRAIELRDGEKPLLPVADHLMYLQQYIDSVIMEPLSKHAPFDSTDTSNHKYLPLRWANQLYRGHDLNDHNDMENMMMDKYHYAALDPMLWRKININFNEQKCQQLLTELTGEHGWDDYVLVNNHSQAGTIDIKPITDLPIIYMHDRPGYTVLDWAFVMLHAQENHHVSTSTFYIFQALVNKYKFKGKVFMYPRPNFDGLRGISKLRPLFRYQIGI